MIARQTDLLLGLAQRRGDGVGVARLDAAAGKGDLAGMGGSDAGCARVSSTDIPSGRSISGTSTAAGRSSVLGGVIARIEVVVAAGRPPQRRRFVGVRGPAKTPPSGLAEPRKTRDDPIF